MFWLFLVIDLLDLRKILWELSDLSRVTLFDVNHHLGLHFGDKVDCDTTSSVTS